MREIKFKVWDKKNKIMIHEDFDRDEIYEKTKDDAYYGDEYYPLCQVDFMFPESNSNFEMLQYTGLKDKNSKEIFEGDIVSCQNKVGQVKYEKSMFIVDFIKAKGHLFSISDECIVVGNIYEHSHLIDNK